MVVTCGVVGWMSAALPDMRRRIRRKALRFSDLLIVVPLLAIALAACTPKPEPYQQEAYVFGTRVELTGYDPSPQKAQQAVALVLADLDRLHKKLHP